MICLSHILVALTNLAYFAMALWLRKTPNKIDEYLLLLVGIVSTIFHLVPNQKLSFWSDILVSNLAIIYLWFVYFPKAKKNWFYVSYILTSTIAFALFLTSGDDRESAQYAWIHGSWHLLSAFSLYCLIKSTM